MKVIILAGGFGTRFSELTEKIPKPMIKINGKPIIQHIINYYCGFGFKEFLIAGGYKYRVIENYFKKKNLYKDINIKIINTGLKTMTGGRLKRLKEFLKKETFMLTYGDGLSNVNLKKLLSFHTKNKGIATLTAVRPTARFGAIKINKKHKVTLFREKSSLDEGWINGGFFILEPSVLNLIKSDKTFFERQPLEILSKRGQLMAFRHKKNWQCMDTLRDKEILENLLTKKILKF